MACNHLRNRVLDLDSRIRLNEVKLFILVQKELNRCGIDIFGLFYNPQGSLGKLLSVTLIQHRTG
ncbi:hypothetical protein ES703_85690 [subsurface metagenome]